MRRLGLLVICVAFAPGCGPAVGTTDAGTLPADAAVAQDAGSGAGVDAGVDAGADAGADAGGDAGADAGIDAGVDAGLAQEQEPNNGATATQVNALPVPGAIGGAVGAANDIDVFQVVLQAGQQWKWTLDAASSTLAPHLSIVEQTNSVPLIVARGTAGGQVVVEQLVLKSSTYNLIVRDSRNVPSSTSQNQGSAAHTYSLTGAASTRTPQVIAVPGTASGTLASRYASALYGFTLTTATPVTLNARAKTKSPPSDLDTRLTLFKKSTNQWAGTNDDPSLSETDARLTGTLDPGEYWVIVENVSETAVDLSFQLAATSP
jgi:hypothetical protein